MRGLKFKIGAFLLIASCLIPLLGLWVATLSLPLEIKGPIIGLLTVGGPELLALAAAAILGKEAFDLLRNKLLSALHKLAPRGSVGRTRYSIGLVLFVVNFLPSWVLAYAPQLLPDVARISINVAADLLFVVSLFILGGDFWDKLRALFVYDARAHFPEETASAGS